MWKDKKRILVALVLAGSLLMPALASAVTPQLQQTSVRLGRLGTSAATGNDMLVTFRLLTTPTSVAKITVTFPAGFAVTTGTPTPAVTGFPNTPNTPTAITAPPGTLTSAATSGTRTIVVSGLTSLSLSAATLYGFIIPTGTITNPATTGQYNVTVESDNSGGTVIDQSTVPVFITTGAATDQVGVTASVAPNFSFSLSATTDIIPKVDPSGPQTSPGVTMTVGTNSPLGYTAYVKSANAALISTLSPGTHINTGTFNGTPDTITPTVTTIYGLVPTTGTACTTCTGAIAYDGEYNGIGALQVGSFNTTNYSSFVSRNGYTNADQILLQERDAVSTTVGYANDYTDTLTVVAAGNF